MNRLLESMTEKDTYTANGAVTNSTSHNACLDLFFLAGACRNESEQNIINKLVCAYDEDRVKCLKIIFWAGDIRQGAGERRFFKLALKWLNEFHQEDLVKYLSYVPEFSRWDVLFDLVDNDKVLDYICENIKTNGLLCKWLPRKNRVKDKHKCIIKNLKLKGEVAFRTDVPVRHNYNKFDCLHIKKDDFYVMYDGEDWVDVISDNSMFFYYKKNKTFRDLFDGLAGKIQKKLGLSAKDYRKLLVENTKVVEQKMCAKDWQNINYEHVPSVAMNKYNKAWYRNDGERFTAYLESVKSGEKKINASAIFPHDIIKNALYGNAFYYGDYGKLNEAQITQWNNLPNWLEGKANSIIPVCDVSGSMNGLPICISIALGLYISERNEGDFKDAFITFSEKPQLQYLKGNINDRIYQLIKSEWGMNTDFEAVFDLILDKAVYNRLSQDDIPKTILAISDMEFDCATSHTETNFNTIKAKFERYGYKLPQIVFWNVNGRVGNLPVTMRDENVALVSGASPSIIRAVLTDNINPIKIMDNTIETERYNFIQ